MDWRGELDDDESRHLSDVASEHEEAACSNVDVGLCLLCWCEKRSALSGTLSTSLPPTRSALAGWPLTVKLTFGK